LVVINPPPPTRVVNPMILGVPVGTPLVRLFDPTTKHHQTPCSFRMNGPRKRFDHHQADPKTRDPIDNPDRGIYYSGAQYDNSLGLACCIVELFGDTGVVDFGEWHIAMPTLNRAIQLLDLRHKGAMRAGSAIAVTACDHQQSQPWSRYFYENPEIYTQLDGIMYPNAHNGELSLALYERAKDALDCSASPVRLDHPGLRSTVLAIMRDHSLTFDSP